MLEQYNMPDEEKAPWLAPAGHGGGLEGGSRMLPTGGFNSPRWQRFKWH